jgi:hypothetical protein
MFAVLCEVKGLLQRRVTAANNRKLLILETRAGACSIVALLVTRTNSPYSTHVITILHTLAGVLLAAMCGEDPTIADGAGADAIAPVLLLAR